MQPPTSPNEDLHTILDRFQTWSGKQAETGNGHRNGSVREIPMEEAVRRLQSRRARPVPQRPAAKPAPQQKSQARDAAEPMMRATAAPDGASDASLAIAQSASPEQEPAPQPRAQASAAKLELKRLPQKMAAVQAAPKKAAKARQPAKKMPRKAKELRAETAPMKMASRKARKLRAETAPMKMASRKARKLRAETAPAKKTLRKARKLRACAVPAVKMGKSRTQPFREVLARSLKGGKTRAAERLSRVSVRLSRSEERQLQRCAAEAGLTLSAYLRKRALPPAPQDAEAKRGATTGRKCKAEGGPERLFGAGKAQDSSSLGWLSLLRRRFLAAPPRFAERA